MADKKIKAQEEMVGFALIIIIVSVILLIFLGFSISRGREEQAIESYEVESFIQSSLEYTTDCADNLEYLSIKKLIFSCDSGELCEDERDTCRVLNSTLKEIVDESWKIGEERPLKGYKLDIISEDKEVLLIQEGNITKNYKGGVQSFNRRGIDYEIIFNVYY